MIAVLWSTKTALIQMTNMMNSVVEKRENPAPLRERDRLEIVHLEAKKHDMPKMTMKMMKTMRMMTMEISRNMIYGALIQKM